MKLKLNIRDAYIGFIFFSTIFFIKYILIKPVYIVLFLLILFGYTYKRYYLNIAYLIVSMLFIFFLILHLIFLKSDPGVVLNAILSIFSFPIIFYYIKKVNLNQAKIFLNLSIFYFFIEMVWRITHPIYELNDISLVSDTGEGWFYPYKINSFIFTDSNYIALHLFCLIFISLLFKLRLQFFWLSFLMLLTFSRSGILGALLVTFYFLFEYSKFRKILKPVFILSILAVFSYIVANISMLTDGSFLSKFYIYESAINYANSNFKFMDYLFGVGLSHTFDLINIGAHSIWVILLFETGILGLIIYFIYFSVFYSNFFCKSKKTRQNLTFFIIIFLMMGFSLGLYLFPIMILTIACILALSGKKHAI